MQREIDRQASTVTIRTRAKGLLSKLAHDLEIQAARFDGDVEVSEARWKATLRFSVSALTVAGALKGDKVDRAVLSPSDRAEIERKIRDEVLVVEEIVVIAEGSDRSAGDVVVKARRGEQRRKVTLHSEDRPGGEIVTYGTLDLSLRALGIEEIKGPLGAFKVDDRIEVAFWIMLAWPA